jgi:hypothetical protein
MSCANLLYAAAVQRAWAYLVSVVVLAAMLWPLGWAPYEDSFPLSSYPMFSNPRESAEMALKYAVGVSADGERSWIEPGLVANGEVLQARATISRSIKAGKAAAKKLCRDIAARIAARGTLPAVEEIRLVTGVHDAVAYLTGRDRVGKEKVHAKCPVPGREAAP